MKTKIYTYSLLFTFVFVAIFSSATFGQWGRHRHDRGYHRNYHYYRSYSYGHPYFSIHFGGYNYRYQRGYFYRPYGSVFQFAVPPLGIRIHTLPYGYRSFYYGPDPYYYYDGIYYRQRANDYEVVNPPLGSVVPDLPRGAKARVIDGQKFYELNGTYYKEEINENNEVNYKVVGTDGVLNTDNNPADSYEPRIGDRIDNLPLDSKQVVIQGEKLYKSPDGLYYKKMNDGNRTYYELVGK